MSKNQKQAPITKMRGYKMRFYPTRAQVRLLSHVFGVSRFTYNWALNEKSIAWKRDQESIGLSGLSKNLTALKKEENHTWLKDVPASFLTQSLMDLMTGYKHFFDKKSVARYPTHKKKRHAQSARMQLDQRHIAKYFSNVPGEEFFSPPGLGPLKVKFSRNIKGIPKMATFSITAAGEYFVSFNCQEDITPLPQTNRSIGVDLGIKDVAVDSNGQASGNPKYYRQQLKKLAKHQRRFAKMKKGGSRWAKQRLKIAKLQDRVMRCRRDFLHLISNQLINENQVIVLEDLHVKGMMKNKKLARSLADSSLGELKRQLQYKAQWFGREVLQVDRWFPSSQLCSTQGCDYRNHDLTLNDRSWICPECKTNHDRDVNAANNILIEGLTRYRELHGSLPAGLTAG